MALTVKHLNSDASFLLTFQPLPTTFPPVCHQSTRETFNVVLDPWLSGPSKILHPRFSISRNKVESCVKNLNDLEAIDLIIISQDKSDHCHKETLTQLPRDGGNALILAEPSAAKVIRGWKYFEPEKVITIPKFEPGKPSTVHRIPIPSTAFNGTPGEVTITFLTQKMDLTRLHSAVAITYLAPRSLANHELTPPATPQSSNFSTGTRGRALSVIHAPHGINYKAVRDYACTHLIEQTALPLTALLHCFDRIQNAWYLGGNICSGMPGGVEIARKLGARAWVSAHDGEKDIKGLANKKIVVQKYEREVIEQVVSPMQEEFTGRAPTNVIALDVGEEIRLTVPFMDEEYEAESDDELEQNVKPSTAVRNPSHMASHMVMLAPNYEMDKQMSTRPSYLLPEHDKETTKQDDMENLHPTSQSTSQNAEAELHQSTGAFFDQPQNHSFDSEPTFNDSDAASVHRVYTGSSPHTAEMPPSALPRNTV